MDYYNFFSVLLNNDTKRYFFSNRFNFMMKNYTNYIACDAMPINTSITYLFEHIDRSIILILNNFIPTESRKDLLIYDYQSDIYKNKLIEILQYLNCKTLILLFFLNVNYFLKTEKEKDIRDNMNYLISKSFLFDNIDELSYNIFNTSIQPFYFQSYKNMNNKSLFIKRCNFYRKICPDLNYNSVEDRSVNKIEKMKIGFISDGLCRDSSVLRDKLGLIKKLDRSKYEIYIISWRDMTTSKSIIAKQLYEEFSNEYVKLHINLSESRDEISNLNLDVLIFGEIGMDSRLFHLAFSRLAPVQINTWGHSDTSGIDTIDYYISSEYFEIDNASEHYSEQLVKFKSLSTYYYRPTEIFLKDYEYKDRSYFELKETDNVYGCIQTCFKISDDFENMIVNILDKDSNGVILLSNNIQFCKDHLLRIKDKCGDNYNRIKIFGNLKQELYLNLVSLCDVILDPFPFGGCNTSFESFDFNIPVVTLPTKFINGRFTYGLYKKMGIDDCIAKNSEDYVNIAVNLCTDSNIKNYISKEIDGNKYLLFEENESIAEWDSFLQNLKK